jgi:hypothetical protein
LARASPPACYSATLPPSANATGSPPKRDRFGDIRFRPPIGAHRGDEGRAKLSVNNPPNAPGAASAQGFSYRENKIKFA